MAAMASTRWGKTTVERGASFERGKSGEVGVLQEVEMQGGGRRWKARARR
jgi:hypothetical protein